MDFSVCRPEGRQATILLLHCIMNTSRSCVRGLRGLEESVPRTAPKVRGPGCRSRRHLRTVEFPQHVGHHADARRKIGQEDSSDTGRKRLLTGFVAVMSHLGPHPGSLGEHTTKPDIHFGKCSGSGGVSVGSQIGLSLTKPYSFATPARS
jgi:hypothetical protein